MNANHGMFLPRAMTREEERAMDLFIARRYDIPIGPDGRILPLTKRQQKISARLLREAEQTGRLW